MKSLALNNNNDIFLDNQGNLSTASDINATVIACACAVKAQLGEMIYAADQGMPNLQTIWNGKPNVPQFEFYLRQTILAVQDVVQITALAIQHKNDVLSYQVTIQTDFGQGVVNGEL